MKIKFLNLSVFMAIVSWGCCDKRLPLCAISIY